MMKVKELIEQLKQCDQELNVKVWSNGSEMGIDKEVIQVDEVVWIDAYEDIE